MIVYLVLMISMRFMGKRQIGELEITDLITTLLVSEIASLPITEENIPLLHAILPILALTLFEIASSYLGACFPGLKNLVSARPATLIRDGKICAREMKHARISADELISQLRQQGITDPDQVSYAILEQNGKISVLPKSKHRPPTAQELKVKVKDEGLYHILIDKGVINRHGLSRVSMTKEDLRRRLSARGLTPKDVYLYLMNDAGKTEIVEKKQVY